MLWKSGKSSIGKERMKLLCKPAKTKADLAESSGVRVVYQNHPPSACNIQLWNLHLAQSQDVNCPRMTWPWMRWLSQAEADPEEADSYMLSTDHTTCNWQNILLSGKSERPDLSTALPFVWRFSFAIYLERWLHLAFGWSFIIWLS